MLTEKLLPHAGLEPAPPSLGAGRLAICPMGEPCGPKASGKDGGRTRDLSVANGALYHAELHPQEDGIPPDHLHLGGIHLHRRHAVFTISRSLDLRAPLPDLGSRGRTQVWALGLVYQSRR